MTVDPVRCGGRRLGCIYEGAPALRPVTTIQRRYGVGDGLDVICGVIVGEALQPGTPTPVFWRVAAPRPLRIATPMAD